jgi:hypothetical protein
LGGWKATKKRRAMVVDRTMTNVLNYQNVLMSYQFSPEQISTMTQTVPTQTATTMTEAETSRCQIDEADGREEHFFHCSPQKL